MLKSFIAVTKIEFNGPLSHKDVCALGTVDICEHLSVGAYLCDLIKSYHRNIGVANSFAGTVLRIPAIIGFNCHLKPHTLRLPVLRHNYNHQSLKL